jgi:hypothetical protein
MTVVREGNCIAHTSMRLRDYPHIMSRLPQLTDNRVLRPAQTALALNLIGRMDFLRLKSIARWHARGLRPDVTWDDLLQEAITRVLVGSRRLVRHDSTIFLIRKC